MSGPDTIDALAVARRVLDNPRTFRVSTNETLAMAGCLIGLDQALDAQMADRTPLLAAVAAVLVARGGWDTGAGPVEPLETALTRLQTLFEQEFPHAQN